MANFQESKQNVLKLLVAGVILFFSFSFLVALQADAATYYVAKTGSDSNSCSQAQNNSTPKLTIQAGVHCAVQPGDTVLVRSGSYVESVRMVASGAPNAPITLKADSATGTVFLKSDLTGQTANLGAAILVSEKSFNRIEGFYFKDSPYGYAVFISGWGDQDQVAPYSTQGNIIINNTFENIGVPVLTLKPWIRSAVFLQYAGPDNIVQGNTFTGIYGEAISIGSSFKNKIVNNTVTAGKSKEVDWDSNGIPEFHVTSGILVAGGPTGNNNYFANNHIYNFVQDRPSSYQSTGLWCDVNDSFNIFEHNSVHDMSGSSYAIYIESSCRDSIVRENIAYNTRFGLSAASFFVSTTHRTQWINNVSYGNTVGLQLNNSEGDVIKNNIVANNSINQLYTSDFFVSNGGYVFKNNLWWHPTNTLVGVWNDVTRNGETAAKLAFSQLSSASGETGAISTDPKFMNADAGDFRLQSNSPAKGSGENDVDMGAYPSGYWTAGVDGGNTGAFDTTLCHTLQNGSTLYDAFAPSWNIFSSSKELFMEAFCGEKNADGTYPVTVNIGNSAQLQYIWHESWQWSFTSNQWEKRQLSGEIEVVAEGDKWLVNSGIANLTPVIPNETTWFVSYICTWVVQGNIGNWYCGCRTTDCTGNNAKKWSLQGIKP